MYQNVNLCQITDAAYATIHEYTNTGIYISSHLSTVPVGLYLLALYAV